VNPAAILAPPPGRTLRGWTIAQAVVGALVALLVGGLPPYWMVGVVGGLALTVTMLFVPLAGLHALLLAVPFAPSLNFGDGDMLLPGAEPFAIVLMLCWFFHGCARGHLRFPGGRLLPALLGLVLLIAVSTLVAWKLTPALKELLKWTLLTFAYVFTATMVRSEAARRGIIVTLLFAGAGEAIYGAVQFVFQLGPDHFALGGFLRAHGTFGQPNPYAGYLGTILPLAIMISAHGERGPLRYVALAAGGLIGLAILLSLSRGAWLGLSIACVVMALVWSARARKAVVPIVLYAIVFGLMGVIGALPPAIGDRIRNISDNFGIFDARTTTVTPENFATVERMAHWQAGWEMWFDYPLLGVGAGNYPVAYDDYFVPGWRDPLGHAHNYYLNLAAETGILGPILLVTILVIAIRTIARHIARPRSPFERAIAVGLLGSMVVFCTHNLFDNLFVHGVGMHVGALMGLLGEPESHG
jgi:O-antigen ligase